MKTCLFSLLFLLFFIPLHAQQNEDAEQLIREGIQLHDEGKYEDAIKKYEEALVLEPESKLALYEICFSYSQMKEFSKALEYGYKAIETGGRDENMDPSIYMMIGSAYDDTNQPEKAIEAFDKGLEINNASFLLHYNKGLTYHRMDSIQQAYDGYKNALYLNISHPSSNLNLARIYSGVNDIASAFFYYVYFLMVEPHTERSEQAIQELFALGKGNNITLPGGSANSLHFNLSIALMATEAMSKEAGNLNMTPYKRFETIFKLLSETADETSLESLTDDICKSYYAPLLLSVEEDGYTEVLCRYITYSVDEESKQWLEENMDKVDNFFIWLNALDNSKIHILDE